MSEESSAHPLPGRGSASSRDAILAAGRRLFSTRGYAGTSVADIVREAGTSVGLPYYHFGSKANIFLSIWTDYQRRQRDRTAAAIEEGRRARKAGPELYLAGVRAYLEGAWADRDIVPMMHGPGRPAGFEQTIRNGAERWSRQIARLLPGYEPVTLRHAVLLLNEGLSAMCLELAGQPEALEAARSIDEVVHLLDRLIETIPPVGGGRIGPS